MTDHKTIADLILHSIRIRILKALTGEKKTSQQLVDELKKQGIEIARRTVAKYRQQLNIPPARRRKKF